MHKLAFHIISKQCFADNEDITNLSTDEKRKLAMNEATPAEILTLLAQDTFMGIRIRVADNDSTPTETLALLAKDNVEAVRECVACNPSTPPEALAMLAKDTEVSVQRGIAQNRSASPEALTMLAQSVDTSTRLLVADNPSAPAEALALLAKDSDVSVRLSAAKHNKTSVETLTLLAKDVDSRVLIYLASNPSTPAEILALLAKYRNVNVCMNVARNPSTPAETLALLAKGRDENVRMTVAGNTSTPAETLVLLAQDIDADVRTNVADNNHTPTETLTMLAEDEDEQVQDAGITALQNRSILDNASTLSKQEMKDKGFAGKESFDHKSTEALIRVVPGYTLDTVGTNWVKYIYADDAGNEFPAELFQAFNLHKIPVGNGKPLGWIGGTYDVINKTLYITEMQSDLLQRTYELNDSRLSQFKPYKSRLENRFSGWYYVFMNQAMRYAKELGVSKVALPTTAYYISHVSGAKNIAGIYEKVLANYQHVNEGKWNVIEMAGVQKLAFHKHSTPETYTTGSDIDMNKDEFEDVAKGLGVLYMEPKDKLYGEAPYEYFTNNESTTYL